MTTNITPGPQKVEPVRYPALTFDPAEFVQHVADAGMTQEQSDQLLRDIWRIAVAFVELGFTVGGPMDNSDAVEKIASMPPEALLGFKNSFSDSTSRETVTRIIPGAK